MVARPDRRLPHRRLARAALGVIRSAGPDDSWGVIEDRVATAIAAELDRINRRPPVDRAELERLLGDPGATTEAMHRLATAEPIQQRLPAYAGFILLSQLQLALRHPANYGSSADLAREIAEQLQAALAQRSPALAPLLEAGWNPRYDR